MSFLDQIKWNDAGLVPVVAQEYASGKVLMLAWMNRRALELSVKENRAVYYSRSRQKLWRKGEQSGHVQKIKAIRLDCDGDTVLLQVEQVGLACHTGRARCFYRELGDGVWRETEPVLKDPAEIYAEKNS